MKGNKSETSEAHIIVYWEWKLQNEGVQSFLETCVSAVRMGKYGW